MVGFRRFDKEMCRVKKGRFKARRVLTGLSKTRHISNPYKTINIKGFGWCVIDGEFIEDKPKGNK